MASEWPTCRLGDVIQVRHGWPFKSGLFHTELSGNPIVIGVGNFRYTGGFRFSETVTKEYRGSYPKDFDLAPGEILLVMTCQTAGGEILGIPGEVPDDGRVYLHNQRLGRVILRDPRRVYPAFLYWLFLSPRFNRELVRTASGTKILHTSPSRIEAFTFSLPPIGQQRAIAHALGALDDKIELNRRMSETLEAMARALFKSWFVDFDPVRTKGQSTTPIPEAVEHLFPDSFNDSELGSIPAGWSTVELGELADIEKGLSYKGRGLVESGGLPMVNLGCFGGDGVFKAESIKRYAGEHRERHVVATGDLVVANTDMTQNRVVLGSPALVPSLGGERRFLFTHHTFAIRFRAGEEVWRHYVYFALLQPRFREVAEGFATGTTVLALPKDGLLRLKIVLPHERVRDVFESHVSKWLGRAHAVQAESRTLAALRDTLLPKLVSGELRVKDAERFVGEAV